MKRITILALVLVMALSLCACRMGGNEETTTVPTTQPETTTMPVPTTTEPMIPDLTFETNIPDTNVDDEHMTDTTGGSEGNSDDSAVPSVRRRFN